MNRGVWDRVAALFRYPYDILDNFDTMGMLEHAATTEASDWKRRMKGRGILMKKLWSFMKKFYRHLRRKLPMSTPVLTADGVYQSPDNRAAK